MPPQQPKGLLDLVDDGCNFGAHDFTGSRKDSNAGCSDHLEIVQALPGSRDGRFVALQSGSAFRAAGTPPPDFAALHPGYVIPGYAFNTSRRGARRYPPPG
jgi:hypothetical protein